MSVAPINNGNAVRSSIGAAGLSSARGLVATVAKGLVSGQQFIEPEGGSVLPTANTIPLTESSVFCLAWFCPAQAGFGESDDLVRAAATEPVVARAAGVDVLVRSGAGRLVLQELCPPATMTVSVAWSESAKVFVSLSTPSGEVLEALVAE